MQGPGGMREGPSKFQCLSERTRVEMCIGGGVEKLLTWGREAGEEKQKPTACGGRKTGGLGWRKQVGKRVWEGLGGCQGLVFLWVAVDGPSPSLAAGKVILEAAISGKEKTLFKFSCGWNLIHLLSLPLALGWCYSP